MGIGKNEYLITGHTEENIQATIREFENKYQNYQSRWDFEFLSQNRNILTAQLVDHSYETPRAKGESDSPVYHIRLDPEGENVRLTWHLHWKSSKRSLNSILLWILLVSCMVIFLTIKDDRLVLYGGVWLFCAVLYGAWVTENLLHDKTSSAIFRQMLTANFGAPRSSSSEQPQTEET